MHGNTYQIGKYKTRDFKEVMKELEYFFKIHYEIGSYPGGIHIELTGQNVTECIGGVRKIKGKELHQNYRTYCDPRLNAEQSIEMAFKIASFLNKKINEFCSFFCQKTFQILCYYLHYIS